MEIYCHTLKCNTQYGIDPYCFTPSTHSNHSHVANNTILEISSFHDAGMRTCVPQL